MRTLLAYYSAVYSFKVIISLSGLSVDKCYTYPLGFAMTLKEGNICYISIAIFFS